MREIVDLGDGQWIVTHTGSCVAIDNGLLEDLTLTSVNVEDIALGLANCCRWARQCKPFYSVAQHSVLASCMVPPEHALAALLHDAEEAYLGDLPRPWKQVFPRMAEAKVILRRRIFEAFGVPFPYGDEVTEADNRLLATEAEQVMGWQLGEGWAEPYRMTIQPLIPVSARRLWLRRFHELSAVRELVDGGQPQEV